MTFHADLQQLRLIMQPRAVGTYGQMRSDIRRHRRIKFLIQIALQLCLANRAVEFIHDRATSVVRA